jgi:hypothetical protein
MSSMNNSSIEDAESVVSVSVVDLQRQLNDLLKQLSPERLRVLADFAAYLADAESEAATQDLLAIPKAQYTSWRTLRSDV